MPSASLMIVFVGVVLLQACKKHDYNPPVLKTHDLLLVAQDLVSPLTLMEAPDGSRRLFVLDQVGKVWIIAPDGTMKGEPFIDVSSKMISLGARYDERGSLGMAFHPDFKSNGRFYLYYTAMSRTGGPAPGVNWNHLNRILQFTVVPGQPDQADGFRKGYP